MNGRLDCSHETMREEDLDEVIRIEKAVFKHPWSKDFFRLIMEDPNNYVITLKKSGRILGYGGYHFLGEQPDFLFASKKHVRVVHLINIAVEPASQSRGFGSHILRTLLNHARTRNGTFCYLEVRPSNSRAITFYRKAGFSLIGIIDNYYPLEMENAFVMGKEVDRLVTR